MRELSVAEQRYQAVLAVIADGETVSDVAARFGVSRKTVHAWLNKYEAGGLEALADGSRRPRSCPHQMPTLPSRTFEPRHDEAARSHGCSSAAALRGQLQE